MIRGWFPVRLHPIDQPHGDRRRHEAERPPHGDPDRHRDAYGRLGRLASNVVPEALDVPGALPGWNVQTLLDHTLGFVAALTDCANGRSIAEASATGLVPSDPVGAVQRAVHDSDPPFRGVSGPRA